MDYPWWDLDGCELASVLYNILAPFQLSDHTYQDWGDFVRKDPDFAYAWSVGLRLNVLEEAIIALRPNRPDVGSNGISDSIERKGNRPVCLAKRDD